MVVLTMTAMDAVSLIRHGVDSLLSVLVVEVLIWAGIATSHQLRNSNPGECSLELAESSINSSLMYIVPVESTFNNVMPLPDSDISWVTIVPDTSDPIMTTNTSESCTTADLPPGIWRAIGLVSAPLQ